MMGAVDERAKTTADAPAVDRRPDGGDRRRVWLAGAGLIAFTALTVGFSLATPPPPADPVDGGGDLTFVAIVFLFPIAGFFVLARQPSNRTGWILVAIGYAWVWPGAEIGEWGMSRGIAAGAVLAALSAGMWAPPIVLTATVLLLRFPDGELLSPRWRKVEWFAIATVMAIVAVIAVYPGDFADLGYPDVRNPLALDVVAIQPVLPAILLCLPVAIVLSAASLILRFRRSRGVERLQIKWLATAGAIIALIYLVGMLASIPYVSGGTEPGWLNVLSNVSFVSFGLIPIAIGIAVLRYRLYEIDVVINKAIVYGALAAFVTVAYVGIVVGVGRAIGTDRSLALQIAATVVVAVAFQPLRERLQRFANRLVYGRRATPYQVLSRFAEQVAGTYATDEVGSAIARLLVEGTGAERAEIWLRRDGEPWLEASWPAADGNATTIPTSDDRTRVVPVLHRGETLGDLVIRKAANEPVGPGDERLLTDVAGQAGLVLRNVRLIEDLRASRQRIVAARDAERRKLERDIHDGAQQRLVALAVLYTMASTLARSLDDERAGEIEALGARAQMALETLRELARGIYPAVLSDRGLVPALESLARKSPMPVEVVAHGVARYGGDLEAAVYFCCLEALHNVAKHASATRAVVRLEDTGDDLRFSVEDDGAGFDVASNEPRPGMQNMQDRLAAIGGSLEVRSRPAEGSVVSGRVPLRPSSRAPGIAA
jgi:signal transduction histidine kinase